MILLKESIGNDFIIRMLWKWSYYKNALEMILLYEYTGNDFIIEMDCI